VHVVLSSFPFEHEAQKLRWRLVLKTETLERQPLATVVYFDGLARQLDHRINRGCLHTGDASEFRKSDKTESNVFVDIAVVKRSRRPDALVGFALLARPRNIAAVPGRRRGQTSGTKDVKEWRRRHIQCFRD